MVARWIPATTELDFERLCLAAGVTIRTVPDATHAYYTQMPSGPLFLIQGWPQGAMRQTILCKLWCSWVVERFGADAIAEIMRVRVASAAPRQLDDFAAT